MEHPGMILMRLCPQAVARDHRREIPCRVSLCTEETGPAGSSH